MAEMTVTISETGDVQVSVSCVKGATCKDVSKAIEKALGATVKDTATPEMYQTGGSRVLNQS